MTQSTPTTSLEFRGYGVGQIGTSTKLYESAYTVSYQNVRLSSRMSTCPVGTFESIPLQIRAFREPVKLYLRRVVRCHVHEVSYSSITLQKHVKPLCITPHL